MMLYDASFSRRDYVENDVDIDVPLKTIPTKGSKTGFSGNQTAADRLKLFPVSSYASKETGNCL